jgi:diguanylate cyclase (GGDEF)-like protein
VTDHTQLQAPVADDLERVPAVLYVMEGGRVVYVSPHAETLLGFPRERWLGAPTPWPPSPEPFKIRCLDGHTVWVRDQRHAEQEDGAERVYGALVEVPDPEEDRYHHEVTGLPRLDLLREHLDLAIARARQEDRSVALMHAGLDGLDLVRDALGPAAHETVLYEIGARVREAMPETALVATMDGGELGVLLTDLPGDAEQVAETAAGQLLVAIRRTLVLDGSEFELNGSIGVSLLPRDASDAEGLLRHAHAAMRQARESDGDQLVFYAGATSDALERLLLSARLRRALERDEFVLHYQPIFRLDAGTVMGVEALLRWQDPQRGLTYPLDFIGVAEYTGLIEPIGRWVIDAACAQARAWRDAGLRVPVSFNVSLRQFREPEFVAVLRDRIAEHELDPSLFMVEITESVAMRDPSCVEPVVDELRALGVRLAIDDFGAGYSSLARLRDLSVDMLKIDRTFLGSAPADARATSLVSAALHLVDALGLAAVAEGVETEEQRSFLAGEGCPLAQGFHLARPLPVDEVTLLLRDRGAAL